GGSNAGDEGETPSASAIFPGCNVSSRRPGSEPGGRRCNSRHPDHFGWLAEQQCPGPENRVSLRAAWVRSLHHPPISYSSCSSKAEHPADNRKTQERYLPGRPFHIKARNHENCQGTQMCRCRLSNAKSSSTPRPTDNASLMKNTLLLLLGRNSFRFCVPCSRAALR